MSGSDRNDTLGRTIDKIILMIVKKYYTNGPKM